MRVVLSTVYAVLIWSYSATAQPPTPVPSLPMPFAEQPSGKPVTGIPSNSDEVYESKPLDPQPAPALGSAPYHFPPNPDVVDDPFADTAPPASAESWYGAAPVPAHDCTSHCGPSGMGLEDSSGMGGADPRSEAGFDGRLRLPAVNVHNRQTLPLSKRK